MNENIKCAHHELVELHKLQPNPRNPNSHPKEQIKLLSKLIDFQGQRLPIIVSKRSGFLVAGHGRLEALKLLGWTKAAVDFQDFANEAQELAFMVSDNKIQELAESDDALIQEIARDLGDLDLDLLGIPDFELIDIDQLAGGDPDAVPELPEEPKTKLGDIYRLGKHRLLCGDSTSITDYQKLMIGEKPILMVTDPPYGVKLDMSWRTEALGDKLMAPTNNNLVSNDDRADWYDVWSICNADIAYVWHASAFSDVVMDSLKRAAFDVRQQIIWNKSVLIMGRGAYHWKHEPCWYAVRKGCDANWKGDRKQVTVWDAAPPTHIMGGSKEERTVHPTQKPAVLYDIPILNHTVQGDLLFEPFSGSGTAFIAAEQNNRRVYGIELDPKYCDVIVERWEKFTGKKAELLKSEA